MGVTLPKDMRFAGFKAGVIKAGLKSWRGRATPLRS